MKKLLLLLLLFGIGCTHKPASPTVHINLVNNSHSVKFTGLDYAVVSDINRDSIPDVWQGLIPVFRMPADTDMKDYQPVQPGRYQLKDSAVVFTPDTPFIKGQLYFMRYYRFGEGQGILDFIKNKKRLGKAQYTDLIFKQ
ncbi:MAG: hypothetical protein JWQ84_388 [Mucilaginibacter sp.]|nr:hypothetical protein [Mucilaginibacter sp.]